MKLKITSHATERAWERFRLRPESLERMAYKAFENGVRRRQTAGVLRRYLDDKLTRSNTPRIYGEYLFAFHHHTLVTCYRIPTELVKYVKPKKKRNEQI